MLVRELTNILPGEVRALLSGYVRMNRREFGQACGFHLATMAFAAQAAAPAKVRVRGHIDNGHSYHPFDLKLREGMLCAEFLDKQSRAWHLEPEYDDLWSDRTGLILRRMARAEQGDEGRNWWLISVSSRQWVLEDRQLKIIPINRAAINDRHFLAEGTHDSVTSLQIRGLAPYTPTDLLGLVPPVGNQPTFPPYLAIIYRREEELNIW